MHTDASPYMDAEAGIQISLSDWSIARAGIGWEVGAPSLVERVVGVPGAGGSAKSDLALVREGRALVKHPLRAHVGLVGWIIGMAQLPMNWFVFVINRHEQIALVVDSGEPDQRSSIAPVAEGRTPHRYRRCIGIMG